MRTVMRMLPVRFFVLLVFAGTIIVFPGSAGAVFPDYRDEVGSGIDRALPKNLVVTDIHRISTWKDWATAGFTLQDRKTYQFYAGSALLKKEKGDRYRVLEMTSGELTVDFLKKHGVPAASYESLTDSADRKLHAPVLEVLRKEQPGYVFEAVSIRDSRAVVVRSDSRTGKKGYVLLSESGKKWTVLFSGEGRVTKKKLTEYKFPRTLVERADSFL